MKYVLKCFFYPTGKQDEKIRKLFLQCICLSVCHQNNSSQLVRSTHLPLQCLWMTHSGQITTPADLNVSAVKNASAVSGARATVWRRSKSGCYTSGSCLLISLLSVSEPPAIPLSPSVHEMPRRGKGAMFLPLNNAFFLYLFHSYTLYASAPVHLTRNLSISAHIQVL